MNYVELKTRLADILHRADLTGQMDNFVQDATERINARFGTAFPHLVLDTDTNAVLEAPAMAPEQPDAKRLYIFASLVSAYTFTNDGENALSYDKQFESAASAVAMAHKIPELDPYTVDGVAPAVGRAA
jgi:hypothetical protein